MKKCPECGHIEYEYWRQNMWRTNVEFCPIGEFKANYPKLAQDLLNRKIAVTDKTSAYRLSGRNKTIVERVIIEEYNACGMQAFHIPREKVTLHTKHVFQTKLKPDLFGGKRT